MMNKEQEHQHEFEMKVALTEENGVVFRFCKICGKLWIVQGSPLGWAVHWLEIREPF